MHNWEIQHRAIGVKTLTALDGLNSRLDTGVQHLFREV